MPEPSPHNEVDSIFFQFAEVDITYPWLTCKSFGRVSLKANDTAAEEMMLKTINDRTSINIMEGRPLSRHLQTIDEGLHPIFSEQTLVVKFKEHLDSALDKLCL